MNVAGVKLDCFPTLFHLRAVRAFLDGVSRSLPPEEEARIRTEAEAVLGAARLDDTSVLTDLEIGQRPLTREEITAARLPQEKLHGFIASRLQEDVGQLVGLAEGTLPAQPVLAVVERARATIAARVAVLVNGSRST